MTQIDTINRRIVLASRPFGAPIPANFRLEQIEVPEEQRGDVLIRNIYLSLDPYMRGRMSDQPSYAPPTELGQVMPGATVGQVISSKSFRFRKGDWVLNYSGGWQDYSVQDAWQLIKLDKSVEHPSYALGILGMPGFTGYMGLMEIGSPKTGETLVVAAATGPVGATVGQVAKIKGCRVVGIAGGTRKCQYAVEKLGFDVCLDHHQPDLAEQLVKACPSGVDIYYENVGGKIFEAVLPLLNTSARIPVCGLISQYNTTEPSSGSDQLPLLMRTILTKRIRMQGFIIFNDYGSHFNKFHRQMNTWLTKGMVTYLEQQVEGLEQAPEAFIGMLEGKNFGKLVVEIAAVK